jgi:hypothetical protein
LFSGGCCKFEKIDLPPTMLDRRFKSRHLLTQRRACCPGLPRGREQAPAPWSPPSAACAPRIILFSGGCCKFEKTDLPPTILRVACYFDYRMWSVCMLLCTPDGVCATLHIGLGLCDCLCLVLVCRGHRHGFGGCFFCLFCATVPRFFPSCMSHSTLTPLTLT